MIPTGRAEAARLVGHLLSSEEGRRMLAPDGRGRPVIPAEWDEPIGDVMDRVRSQSPPATVAILRAGELKCLTVEPGPPAVASDQVSARSSIGMLYEAVEHAQRRTLTMHVTEWDVVTASPVLANA